MPTHPSVAAQTLIKAYRKHNNIRTLAIACMDYAPRRDIQTVIGYVVHYLGDDQQEGAFLVALERVVDEISANAQQVAAMQPFQVPPLGTYVPEPEGAPTGLFPQSGGAHSDCIPDPTAGRF